MPILEVVTGGYLVGKGAMIISATLGGGLVMAGNYFFGKQSAKDKEALERLTVIKETREQARVQNLSEVVEGLEQRKQHLDEASLKHQAQMEVIVDGFDKDKTLIDEQAEHLGKTNTELEQCIKEQQAMLLSLQLAFKEMTTHIYAQSYPLKMWIRLSPYKINNFITPSIPHKFLKVH